MFELVGLGYSAWFTYRYLLFKSRWAWGRGSKDRGPLGRAAGNALLGGVGACRLLAASRVMAAGYAVPWQGAMARRLRPA